MNKAKYDVIVSLIGGVAGGLTVYFGLIYGKNIVRIFEFEYGIIWNTVMIFAVMVFFILVILYSPEKGKKIN